MENYLQYARTFNANKFVCKWVETTLKNYLVKNTPSTEEVEHILDYLINTNKKIERMSYTDALLLADRWTASQQKKGEHIRESKSDVQTVLDFKDGFRIVKLVGEAAYKREGFLMSHCVGGYYGNGKEVFSLRDRKNIPHCTIEKDQQIKGKGNGNIHPKYIDYVVQFLEYSGMKVRDSEMGHLGYKVVPFAKYCTNPRFRGKYVPVGTEIAYRDDMILVDSIDALSSYIGNKHICFSGSLDLQGTSITALPDNLSVGGSLYLQGTSITALPDNLSVGGSLDLQGTSITALPDNLSVGGYLDLQGTPITALPDNLSVGGYLDLQGTPITALPDNLSVGSSLDLRGTKIAGLAKLNKKYGGRLIY